MMTDPIRVLHVDDEPGFGELVATFLEREDERISVVTAADTAVALERLDGDSVDALDADCVVSDYDMPETNGIELLESVRETRPELPFILFTGKGSEEIASEAISAGVTDYLQKERGTEQYAILANRIGNAVDRYRSRQALAERNQELRIYERIFNTMQEGACLYDTAGRFALVNDHLADFYGTTPAELEGQSSRLIERLRDEPGDPFQALVDGERTGLQGELDVEMPSVGSRTIEYRLTALTDQDTVEGVVGVARDVTERKNHERAIQRSREEYRELLNGMHETVWVIGLDERFRAVNDAAIETLGYDRKTLRSMTPHDIDTGLEADTISTLIAEMPDDEIQVFETVHETSDGERIPVEISSSLITYRGETAILSIARDITDRKARQRRLEEFAAVVSHDLRNPLTVARGHLELAREECNSERLADVEHAHERMAVLIDDLLTLAKAGGGVSQTELVSLADLAQRTWKTVATANATLTLEGDRTIRADPSRLQQLLENLVRNAVEHGSTGRSSHAPEDAAEHGGANATVTVGSTPTGFYVEDDGPGISPAERETVFETGYSTATGGTGLGLAIVEGVAAAHDWDVRVVEGTDGGARFEITNVESA